LPKFALYEYIAFRLKIPQQEMTDAREVSSSCSKLLFFSDFDVERMQELSACSSCVACSSCRWGGGAGCSSSGERPGCIA